MKYKIILLLFLVVFFTCRVNSQSVSLNQLGKDNLFLQYSFQDYFNGNLYTISNGALYKTNLSNGDHTRVGNTPFPKTQFFFGLKNKLYSLENDGSMTQIDPVTGTWSVVSSVGSWMRLSKIIVVGNSLYAIENGSLYYYPAINAQLRKQIGGSDFYDTGLLMRSDSSLFSLISDGSLYEIKTSTGKWEKIGKGRAWKYAKTGAVVNGKLYTVETPSSLYETDLSDGSRKELDNSRFKKIKLLFADSGKLYAISNQGTLYEIILN